MALFNTPVPIPPRPGGSASRREGDTILALGETQDIVKKVVSYLAEYQPTEVVSRSGRKYVALARQGGSEPVEDVEPPLPFQLIVTTSTGPSPVPKIRVVASTIAGGTSADLGFANGDDPPYLLTPSTGKVFGGITINSATGAVTSRFLNLAGAIPADSNTTFYVEIGTVGFVSGNWIVSNSRYGPITAQICRNWFNATAPFWSVTWLVPPL